MTLRATGFALAFLVASIPAHARTSPNVAGVMPRDPFKPGAATAARLAQAPASTQSVVR